MFRIRAQQRASCLVILADTGKFSSRYSRISLQPARMVSEIPLAILPAALWVAATGRSAFVRVNFKANLCGHRQNQDLARLIAPWMADKGLFAGSGGCAPEHHVADAVVVFRAGGALALFCG